MFTFQLASELSSNNFEIIFRSGNNHGVKRFIKNRKQGAGEIA